MPKNCCIVGCHSRLGVASRSEGIRFFRIPQCIEKRRLWIDAIGREIEPQDSTRVCGRHFVSRHPSDDSNDSDYAPSLYLNVVSKNLVRKRSQKQTVAQHTVHVAKVS
jgi:hypothetical protein